MAILIPVSDTYSTLMGIDINVVSCPKNEWEEIKREYGIKGDPRAICIATRSGADMLYINPTEETDFMLALDAFGVRAVADKR